MIGSQKTTGPSQFHVEDNTVTVKTPKKYQTYSFSGVYSQENQEKLAIDIATDASDWVINGYNALVIGCGVSGSGITKTLIGQGETEESVSKSQYRYGSDSSSILHQLLISILSLTTSSPNFAFGMSVFELRGEDVFDLLLPSAPPVNLDSSNMTSVAIDSLSDALSVLYSCLAHSVSWKRTLKHVYAKSTTAHLFVRLSLYNRSTNIISTVQVVDLATGMGKEGSESKKEIKVRQEQIHSVLKSLKEIGMYCRNSQTASPTHGSSSGSLSASLMSRSPLRHLPGQSELVSAVSRPSTALNELLIPLLCGFCKIYGVICINEPSDVEPSPKGEHSHSTSEESLQTKPIYDDDDQPICPASIASLLDLFSFLQIHMHTEIGVIGDVQEDELGFVGIHEVELERLLCVKEDLSPGPLHSGPMDSHPYSPTATATATGISGQHSGSITKSEQLKREAMEREERLREEEEKAALEVEQEQRLLQEERQLEAKLTKADLERSQFEQGRLQRQQYHQNPLQGEGYSHPRPAPTNMNTVPDSHIISAPFYDGPPPPQEATSSRMPHSRIIAQEDLPSSPAHPQHVAETQHSRILPNTSALSSSPEVQRMMSRLSDLQMRYDELKTESELHISKLTSKVSELESINQDLESDLPVPELYNVFSRRIGSLEKQVLTLMNAQSSLEQQVYSLGGTPVTVNEHGNNVIGRGGSGEAVGDLISIGEGSGSSPVQGPGSGVSSYASAPSLSASTGSRLAPHSGSSHPSSDAYVSDKGGYVLSKQTQMHTMSQHLAPLPLSSADTVSSLPVGDLISIGEGSGSSPVQGPGSGVSSYASAPSLSASTGSRLAPHSGSSHPSSDAYVSDKGGYVLSKQTQMHTMSQHLAPLPLSSADTVSSLRAKLESARVLLSKSDSSNRKLYQKVCILEGECRKGMMARRFFEQAKRRLYEAMREVKKREAVLDDVEQRSKQQTDTIQDASVENAVLKSELSKLRLSFCHLYGDIHTLYSHTQRIHKERGEEMSKIRGTIRGVGCGSCGYNSVKPIVEDVKHLKEQLAGTHSIGHSACGKIVKKLEKLQMTGIYSVMKRVDKDMGRVTLEQQAKLSDILDTQQKLLQNLKGFRKKMDENLKIAGLTYDDE
ncbi:hypothetical protein ADUPG1_008323 [Aduncisulcus paluster]|uniref:Kinesin motor domain-containing protein n=1 Tax=Aduncisulcus paluster TaxID=2918883 RepID=A0ABQ5KUI7_9EUKA|nr:hypothetical protein ADUPG1_008323 [Aduncisulcus paluster]